MARNYDSNAERIAAIIAHLPGTLGQIHQRSGVSAAALSRWLPRLVEEKLIHFIDYFPSTHGGPIRAIYRAGPKPPRVRVKKPKPKTALQRVRKHRRAARAAGTYEETLAARRAKSALSRKPKIDPLMQAFFGIQK